MARDRYRHEQHAMKHPSLFACIATCLVAGLLPATPANGSSAPQAWSVGLATTFWNRASAPTDAPWMLPGALLGGEAVPSGRGVLLDNAQVDALWTLGNGFSAVLSVAAHGNQDISNASAEIHSATLGWQSAHGHTRIDMGKRLGVFSPDNHSHAEQRLFSQLPLAQTVLLGGQYLDGGVHLRHQWRQWQLGYELWNGQHFPAGGTDDEFTHDIYLRYDSPEHSTHHESAAWSWSGGIWAMTAAAEQREDTRYSSGGHSHGSLSSNTTLAEYYFSGDTDLGGVFAQSNWHLSRVTTLTLRAAAMIAKPQGRLADSTRQVEFSGRYEGGYLQLSTQWRQHTLGAQVERLSLSNTLTGAAASVLESAAGLSGNLDNPQRYGLVYRYQLSPQLALRGEWLKDAGQPDANQRLGLGVLWHNGGNHSH